MGRFKKGLLLGGILGAALMWLNVTPKGKEMRDKIMEHADALFMQLKESMKQLEGPTKEMYDALVERATEEYANKREMAMDVKAGLVKELKKRWGKLENEIKNR
ncbi:MAG: YtxH domain-containing protein [Patescibacteria group bacterium]